MCRSIASTGCSRADLEGQAGARGLALGVVEAVRGDHERGIALLDVVDGREAVGDAADVDEHHRPDRDPNQFVPREPEPLLASRAAASSPPTGWGGTAG